MKFGRSAWVVEAACTLARRQHRGLLSSDDHHELFTVFDYDLAYRYNVLGVEPVVIDKARQMANRQPLRAYDVVHLATAWLLNEDLAILLEQIVQTLFVLSFSLTFAGFAPRILYSRIRGHATSHRMVAV